MGKGRKSKGLAVWYLHVAAGGPTHPATARRQTPPRTTASCCLAHTDQSRLKRTSLCSAPTAPGPCSRYAGQPGLPSAHQALPFCQYSPILPMQLLNQRCTAQRGPRTHQVLVAQEAQPAAVGGDRDVDRVDQQGVDEAQHTEEAEEPESVVGVRPTCVRGVRAKQGCFVKGRRSTQAS